MEKQEPYTHPGVTGPALRFEVVDGEVVAVRKDVRTLVGPIEEAGEAMADFLPQFAFGESA